MKKYLIVVIMVCAGFVTSEAQSMLRVSLADNSPINVAVDGRYFNKRGTSVTVGDLPYGRHIVQIYVTSQTRRGRTIEEVIYEGKVKTHDGMVTLFVYDPQSNGVQIQERDINAYMSEHPLVGQQQGEGNEAAANNANNEENVAPGASPAPTGSLDDSKIDKLKTKVTAKHTDTEMMNIAKEGLQEETFTVFQVGTMMDWFSFESTKVAFAEWAYPKTVDKEYFSDLESKLTYQNYRDELDKFIKAQK